MKSVMKLLLVAVLLGLGASWPPSVPADCTPGYRAECPVEDKACDPYDMLWTGGWVPYTLWKAGYDSERVEDGWTHARFYGRADMGGVTHGFGHILNIKFSF